MTVDPESAVIGFIGTGVMGRSMAEHLLDAGYKVHVYNRTQSKADDLVARGAVWQPGPAAIAAEADLTITIVGFPPDVESTYFGDDGLIANARPGAILVDMTTSKPSLAARIAARSEAGQILASDVVRQLAAGKGFLFADQGEVALRGFEEPQRLYEVRWQADPAAGRASA